LEGVDWARRVAALGAGEILLTSMDADGTQAGFDCELTATISRAVPIPVIASGGAGGPEHFAEVFLRGAADAALAASIFHYETHSIRSLKEYLRARGVAVRLT
jgi:cyclase